MLLQMPRISGFSWAILEFSFSEEVVVGTSGVSQKSWGALCGCFCRIACTSTGEVMWEQGSVL